VQEVLERVRARGQIGVAVAWTGGQAAAGAPEAGQAAVLILSDTLRPGARELAAAMHGLGVRPVRMLTGDNRVSAEHTAAALGLDEWRAELLPQDKVNLMKEMRRAAHGGVGAIGDGVNDAPILAAADVSIAMGGIGSDAALESADIVLLNDDLAAIPWGVRLARRTRSIVLFNIALATSVMVVMGGAVLAGSLLHRPVPLWLAVIAHEGGTLLVVANSLRLLGVRPARPPASDLAEPRTKEPAVNLT
jgi:Cd2+/Zn2+-exporting ATPase